MLQRPRLFLGAVAALAAANSPAIGAADGSATIPILHSSSVSCTSGLISNGGYEVTLTPEFDFHWRIKDTGALEAALRYRGDGWVALGFSPTDGVMVGARAVIGAPDGSGQGVPRFYDLGGRDVGNVLPIPANIAHVEGAIVQVAGITTMVLETMDWHMAEYEDGLYTFIFAAGYSNELGFHRHHGAFRVDLKACGGSVGDGGGTDGGGDGAALPDEADAYDHRASFVAHGVFAALAFGVCAPLSAGVALFRALVPKWWIYLHVAGNCLAFLFATVSVACAIGGVALRSGSFDAAQSGSHMDRVHHWTGLVLFLTLAWQVLNGFRRPPVEPKPEPRRAVLAAALGRSSGGAAAMAYRDNVNGAATDDDDDDYLYDDDYDYDHDDGYGHSDPRLEPQQPRRPSGRARRPSARLAHAASAANVASSSLAAPGLLAQLRASPRLRWHWTHCLTAVLLAGLALYQLASGLRLFGAAYGSGRGGLLWAWLLLLAVGAAGLAYRLRQREDRDREMLRPGRNLMPQREEEDDDDDRDDGAAAGPEEEDEPQEAASIRGRGRSGFNVI